MKTVLHLVLILPRYSNTKLDNSDSSCAFFKTWILFIQKRITLDGRLQKSCLTLNPQWINWLRGIWLCGVKPMYTRKSDSAMLYTHTGSLLDVIPVVESDSGLKYTSRSLTPWYPSHCEVELSGVMYTTESNSLMSIPLQSLALQGHVLSGVWNRKVWLGGVRVWYI